MGWWILVRTALSRLWSWLDARGELARRRAEQAEADAAAERQARGRERDAGDEVRNDPGRDGTAGRLSDGRF
jgi:hypothetical protein